MTAKRRHLTKGWTWRADVDGEPAVWGIYGHVSDAEAVACVVAYEGDAEALDEGYAVHRDWRRTVPCASTRGAHDPLCDGDCPGTHLVLSDTPGASPFTWVEAT